MAKIGDVGTLRELDVKPGDVVRFTKYRHDAPCLTYSHFDVERHFSADGRPMVDEPYWELISHAQPTIWRDMTPEEKGALLLAAHEGKVIEGWMHGDPEWKLLASPLFDAQSMAYRVKPEQVRETVTIDGGTENSGCRGDSTLDAGILTPTASHSTQSTAFLTATA